MAPILWEATRNVVNSMSSLWWSLFCLFSRIHQYDESWWPDALLLLFFVWQLMTWSKKKKQAKSLLLPRRLLALYSACNNDLRLTIFFSRLNLFFFCMQHISCSLPSARYKNQLISCCLCFARVTLRRKHELSRAFIIHTLFIYIKSPLSFFSLADDI